MSPGRRVWARLNWRTPLLLLLGTVIAIALSQRARDGRAAVELFGASFLFALWLVPLAGDLARRVNALSYPGGRSVSDRIVPLLGGIAVFVPLFLANLDAALGGADTKAMGIALGALVVFVLGALDDTYGVRARTKVLVQLFAGCWLVFSGFRVPELALPGITSTFELGILEIPFILFWVVLVTNALNLIDGLDGLASSVALLAALGCVVLDIQAAGAIVVAGTCLGFLRHNLPRATIFLGDSGSMVLGFALAAFTLDARPETNVPVALALLSYPLADVSLALTRRFLRGKPLFAPDSAHVHHKLLQYLGSPGRALASIALLALLPLLLGLWHPGILSVAVTVLMWVGVAGGIIWAGRTAFARVLLNRRPIQRLHGVSDYARKMIQLADHERDVEMALRHLCERMGVTFLSLGGRRYVLARDDDPDRMEIQIVPLVSGAEARWRGRPWPRDPVLAEERRNLMVVVAREAEARLEALATPESAPGRRGDAESLTDMPEPPRATSAP